MNPTDFLAGPAAIALGWTLLHALWQGFALVLPAAFTLHLLRHRSSAWRYRAGVLTLFAQLVASAVTFSRYYVPATNAGRSAMTAFTSAKALIPFDGRPLTWLQQTRYFLESHLSEFVLIYLIGVVLFGLRLAGGWLYLHRLTRMAHPLTSPALSILTERLRSAMAIRLAVRLRESTRVAVPMLVGVLKPVLLLPVGLVTYLSMAEMEMVLAHELAHVKRADYVVNLVQSVVEVLYFFHPALWWLSARVREEREHCCDDLAVRVSGQPGRVLAQALARVEEFRLNRQTPAPAPTLAVALTNNRRLLLHRVQRALGVPTRPFVSSRSLAGLTFLTVLLLSASVYAIQQQPRPKPKASRPVATFRRSPSTDLHFDANRRLTGVVWKGQTLPASRVAALQAQIDRIMVGQLNLDAVDQPDRDVLLSIIEAHHGMQQSASRTVEVADSVQINGAWMNAAAAARLVESAVAGTGAIDADAGTLDPLAVEQPIATTTDTIVEPSAYRQSYMLMLQRQDSLDQQRAVNNVKIDALKANLRAREYAVEAVERNVERLERQKYFLEQRRLTETSLQRQLIFKTGPANADSTRQAALKHIEAKETSIRKLETDLETLNKQLIEIANEAAKAQEPLREIQEQIRKLQLSNSVQAMSYLMPHSDPTPPQPAERTIRGTGTRAVPATISGKAIIRPTPPPPPPAAPGTSPKAAKARNDR